MAQFRNLVMEWSTLSIAIRLFSAFLVGTLIGIERGAKRRGAGIKTYSLVCLGSSLVMLTGQFISINFTGNMDVARLGAQVISGVGFLGAGTIMVTGRNQVKGLTTAAGLWASACLGLAIGIGFVDGAMIATILIFVTLKVLAKVDSVIYQNLKILELYIEFENNKSISEFFDEMRKNGVKTHGFELGKSKIKGEGPNAVVNLELPRKGMAVEIIEKIKLLEGIHYIEELQ